jgi:hypothetical protein
MRYHYALFLLSLSHHNVSTTANADASSDVAFRLELSEVRRRRERSAKQKKETKPKSTTKSSAKSGKSGSDTRVPVSETTQTKTFHQRRDTLIVAVSYG